MHENVGIDEFSDRTGRFGFAVWQLPTVLFALLVGPIGVGWAETRLAAVTVGAGALAIVGASALSLVTGALGPRGRWRTAVPVVHVAAAGAVAVALVEVVPSAYLLVLHPSVWLAYRCGAVGAAVAAGCNLLVLVVPRVIGTATADGVLEAAAPTAGVLVVIVTILVAGGVGRRTGRLRTHLAVESSRRAEALMLAEDRLVTLDAAFEALDAVVVVVETPGGVRMNERAVAIHAHAGIEIAATTGQPPLVFDVDHRQVLLEDTGLRRVQRGEVFESLVHRIGPIGDQVVLSMTTRPLVRRGGGTFGQVLTAWDITDLVDSIAQRDAFVSTVSHELQTPLTAASAGVEAMRLLRESPLDMAQLADLVERQIATLSRRVQQLLRAGDFVLGDGCGARLEEALLAERLAPHRERARVSDIELGISCSEPTTSVPGNVDAVLEICDQLVGNAVKFTEPGGRVTLTVRVEPQVVVVRCTDTGQGMTRDEVRQATNLFYRSERAVAGAVDGLGVGLTIVRRLVVAAAGELAITSAPGEGTTVEVTLPEPDPAPSAPPTGFEPVLPP